jgi:AmmeMemoRadiSam system protein B
MSGGPRVRPPAVAGSFYPADPPALRSEIQRSFDAAVPANGGAPAPKALMVPHAGYRYSGPVAASGYLRLAPRRDRIRRIVLVGPSHRVPVDGLAAPSVDAFATPLGDVPIDAGARAAALDAHHSARVDDLPHAFEHSLEVQLPFLQSVLEDFQVLPLAVGRCPVDAVTAVLEELWDGDETVVVVSTDLSHYHPQAAAREIDDRTAAAIADLAPEEIRDTDACGATPLRGLLHAARRNSLTAQLIDLRTSGDTAGPRHAVVGYGAVAFC